MRKRQMTQDEYVNWVWNTQSTWGIRRRQRIIRYCFWVGGAIVGIALALLTR